MQLIHTTEITQVTYQYTQVTQHVCVNTHPCTNTLKHFFSLALHANTSSSTFCKHITYSHYLFDKRAPWPHDTHTPCANKTSAHNIEVHLQNMSFVNSQSDQMHKQRVWKEHNKVCLFSDTATHLIYSMSPLMGHHGLSLCLPLSLPRSPMCRMQINSLLNCLVNSIFHILFYLA